MWVLKAAWSLLLLELHEGLGKLRVDRVVFPALTSVMPVVLAVFEQTVRMVFVAIFSAHTVLLVSVLPMPFAHAHTLMRLDLVVFLG